MQPKQSRKPSLFNYIRRIPTPGVLAIGICFGLAIARLVFKPVSSCHYSTTTTLISRSHCPSHHGQAVVRSRYVLLMLAAHGTALRCPLLSNDTGCSSCSPALLRTTHASVHAILNRFILLKQKNDTRPSLVIILLHDLLGSAHGEPSKVTMTSPRMRSTKMCRSSTSISSLSISIIRSTSFQISSLRFFVWLRS